MPHSRLQTGGMTDEPTDRNTETKPARTSDLRGFIRLLDERGQLRRMRQPVSLVHEITEIHRRVLADGGPALLFEQPVDYKGKVREVPLLANLFGTRQRIEWGLGLETGGLPALGQKLTELREPRPPKSMAEAWSKLPLLRAALSMGQRNVSRAPVQERVLTGDAVDLARLPVQWCWPGEPAPLITWPMVITCSPDDPDDINVGIYRMQVLGPDRVIMRWLAHRGGAHHHRLWQARGLDMPVTVAIGADPATILSAVMPLPDHISELGFSGLLRGSKSRIAKALTVPMPVPANAEIVLEGTVSAAQTAMEGPYGDHTGYYNSVEAFPVMTLSAITMRRDPIYLSTYTGRPPDEPSVVGEAMLEIFLPLVKRQFAEIVDLWMPPEACSYRVMVVSIDKRYPGQAKRVMMGLWSMLPQFSYVKLIILVDPDINVRSWADVIWALSSRFDASRDTTIITDTPIDYLDFASPKAGLGGKMGLDATRKLSPETERDWGRVLSMSPDVIAKVDLMWHDLGLGKRP